MAVVPVTARPSSSGNQPQISFTFSPFTKLNNFSLIFWFFFPQAEGFYAINNQFLLNGPKGFAEFKMLENEDMFVRMDFPGVPEECVRVSLHDSKKAVIIRAYAPMVHTHDSSHRSYLTVTGLICKCCQISNFTSHMSDGVLRLLLSKTSINPYRSSCIGDF